MTETILVPFVDNPDSIINESRPHKIVFYDSYIEYFQWHKTNDIEEETGVRKDFFVDLCSTFLKPMVIGITCAYSNKEQLYHIILSDTSGNVTIRFKEKKEAIILYNKIQSWLVQGK